jgi:hypothetical protein
MFVNGNAATDFSEFSNGVCPATVTAFEDIYDDGLPGTGDDVFQGQHIVDKALCGGLGKVPYTNAGGSAQTAVITVGAAFVCLCTWRAALLNAQPTGSNTSLSTPLVTPFVLQFWGATTQDFGSSQATWQTYGWSKFTVPNTDYPANDIVLLVSVAWVSLVSLWPRILAAAHLS